MASLFNLARMSTATTGTGTITLGSAVDGFITFANAGVTDGVTVTYGIEDANNSEVGRGVYTASGTTLTRSVITSTNSDAEISLSGDAEVYITILKEDLTDIVEDAAFGAGWNGDTTHAPSQNAVYDKFITSDTAVSSNTTHRGSAGTDHSNVGLNNTHRGSAGTDHSDVGLNNTHRGLTNDPHSVTAAQVALGNVSNVATDDTAYNATSWNANSDAATKNAIRDKLVTNDAAVSSNTTHRGSDGKDHSDVGLNNTHRGSDGSDHSKATDAIHDNESAEISAVTGKTTPVGADYVLIEDSAASDAKKSVTITNLSKAVDHDTTTNTHNLTTDIDHDQLTNTHGLTTDIDHDQLTNTHNLTTDIDHDALTNFAAGEHFTMLDEDDLSTDSNTQAATQQSVKAYVDGKTDETFVVVSLSGDLANERALTAGVGMTQTDGGAGSTLTYALKDIGARVYHNTTQSINDSSATALVFNSERYDTDAIHDTGSNTERLTAKTAGKYKITGSIETPLDNDGRRALFVFLNGTTTIASVVVDSVQGAATNIVVTTDWNMAVNEYVELFLFHKAGAALTVPTSTGTQAEFMMQLMAEV